MTTYVITGANRGLGLGFARQLAAEGNLVIGTARDVSRASELSSIPGVTVVALDITRADSCKAAADEVSRLTGGAIDVFIANAGHNGKGMFRNVDDYPSVGDLLEDFDLSYRTNVVGSALSINAFLPLVKKGTKKIVVAISSAMGDSDFVRHIDLPSNVPYGASKAALTFLMSKYAIQYENGGLIFFALCPGWVTTQDVPPEFDPKVLEPFIEQLRKVAPECTGPKTLQEGVNACLQVIKGLTPKHNGQFLSYHGDKNWV